MKKLVLITNKITNFKISEMYLKLLIGIRLYGIQ